MPPLFTCDVLTLYPNMFPGPLGDSLIQKAHDRGIWNLSLTHIRDFAKDRHATVDDAPFGGGNGMVLKPDVLGDAIDCALKKHSRPVKKIYLSPRGDVFCQEKAKSLAKEPGMLLLCGRFEGIDQRIIDHYDFEELSLGDYILMGGEVAAMVVIESVVRLLPSVVGKENSLIEESFEINLLEHSHYTRPATWCERVVPDILRAGDHKKINMFRLRESEQLTKKRRPDLWARYENDRDKK